MEDNTVGAPLPSGVPGGISGGPVEGPHDLTPALSAIASGASLGSPPVPIREGHTVSLSAGPNVSPLFSAELSVLNQKKEKLETEIASARSLGRPINPMLHEDLKVINHLITIRKGLEALDNRSLEQKSSEELGSLLHSMVVIWARSKNSVDSIGRLVRYIEGFLIEDPSKEAAVFSALFNPSKEYSQDELDFLRQGLANEKSWLGALIKRCFEASLTDSSEATPSALRQFSSYCESGSPDISALHQQAEEKISKLQRESVPRHSQQLGKNREAFHRSLGVVDRILRAFRLLGQRSSSQAFSACSQILETIDTVISDLRENRTDENKALLKQEIAKLEGDATFQNVLQANPLLKERYLQQKIQLSTMDATVFGTVADRPEGGVEGVGTEIGKIGRFLGHVGLLGHLTPKRALQACSVVTIRLDRAVEALSKKFNEDPDAFRVALPDLSRQILELRENPHFLSVIHSNEDVEKRFQSLESEVKELPTLDNCRTAAEKACKPREKALAAMQLQRFSPQSPRVAEQRNLLCAQYGPEGVRAKVLDETRDIPLSSEELEALYDELGAIESCGLFVSEKLPGAVDDRIERARGFFTEMGKVARERGLADVVSELDAVLPLLNGLGESVLAAANTFVVLGRSMQRIAQMNPELHDEALAGANDLFTMAFTLRKWNLGGMCFDRLVLETGEEVSKLPQASLANTEKELEELCSKADRLRAAANKLQTDPKFARHLERLLSTSSFFQKVQELEAF